MAPKPFDSRRPYEGWGAVFEGDVQLFSDDEDIESYLRGKRKRWSDQIKYASDEEIDKPGYITGLVGTATVHPLTLIRKEARFDDLEERSARIRASVTIPLDGDTRLLRLFNARGPQVYARMRDGGEARSGGGKWLRLRNDFPSDVTAEDVRRWAAQTVEQIELALEAHNTAAAAYNDRLAEAVQELVKTKRNAGSGAARLARELKGKGI